MSGKDKKKEGKGKSKSDNIRNPALGPQPNILVTRLMRTYRANCEATESAMSQRLIEMMNKCITDNTLLVQFIVESPHEEVADGVPLKLEPLIQAIRSERYTHIKCLYIWTYPMCYETMATLSTFIALSFYPITHLELRECLLTPEQMRRMYGSLKVCKNLTHLNLDYNEFGNDGCLYLCEGIKEHKVLLSLSICYCSLGPKSGSCLNDMINMSTVRELYLDGNNLHCEGAMDLISACLDMANVEQNMRNEEARKLKLEQEALAATQKKRPGSAFIPDNAAKPPDKKPEKKGKKKKGNKGAKANKDDPKFGPWLRVLSLADNTIDNLTQESERIVGECIYTYSKFIAASNYLCEIDLGDNLIGNVAAQHLLDGLRQRETNELPAVKLRTTHRLDQSIYCEIRQLAGGAKKKGKGKRKKK